MKMKEFSKRAFGSGLKVKVTVSTPGKGNYACKNNLLTINNLLHISATLPLF